MEIKISETDKQLDFTLKGEFTIYSVSDFKKKLDEIMENSGWKPKIYIDLSGVSRMDTAGIQFLIALKLHSSKKNTQLILQNHSDEIIAMIELYGLMGFFGDPIKLTKSKKDIFPFSYGRKKGFY